MLKYFYKTFLIAVLSGSLLSLQTSVAYGAGTNSTDKNGVITNTQTKTFDKVSDTDMIASLGMLAAGFVTGRMLAVYDPMKDDVMVAGAAGAAFIAGEILSNMKFKGTIDAMSIEIQKKSDGTINEEQIQRLQDLKKSYEEAKSTTKTKKMLQMASAAGFGIAAAMAGYKAYAEYTAMGLCLGAITKAKAAALKCPDTVVAAGAAPLAAGVILSMEASCKICSEGHISRIATSINTINTHRTSPGPSLIDNKKVSPIQKTLRAEIPLTCSPLTIIPTTAGVVAGLLKPCDAVLDMQSLNQIYGHWQKLNPTTNNPMKKFIFPNIDPYYQQMQSINYADTSLIQKFTNFLMPQAEASWLPLLGLGTGLAASFLFATSAAALQLDYMMFVPFNRAVAFAAFAGVALLAANSSDNVMAELDENIKKIDKILADLNKMASGIKAQNLTQQQIKVATINTGVNDTLQFSKNAATKTECLQNNSTANCPSTTNQLQSMPGFANLPDSFKDLAAQSTTLGDNVSGKNAISGSTLSQAENLGNKVNAINKLLKNREAAYEKLTGNKVNFNKEKGNFLEKMNGAVKKALRQKGMTATGMMASIGSTPITGTDKLNVSSPASKEAAVGNVVDISAKGEGKEKDDTLSLNFNEEPTAPAVDMSGGVTSSAEPEYQIDSNEINGQNGPSIFEVLSNRYIKSGYPKLLEEEPTKK